MEIPPIALVTRMDDTTEHAWQSALTAVMPRECILSFREMTAAQKTQASIAIVANPDPADITQLTGLAWIQSLWAGVERLVEELGASAPKIVRLIDPTLSQTMAESVLAWTYYLHRNMPAYASQQRARIWQQIAYRKPSNMTIGILGLGVLGSAAAQRLKQAGFVVKGWSRTEKSLADCEALSGQDGLETLLADSDILVCLLPLTAQTRGLLNAQHLGLMKKTAALINFARGPIIITEELIAALDSDRLAHAVLDVFDQEPLPIDSPLWHHPKITVLPHISAPSDRFSAALIVAENIRSYRESGLIPPTITMTNGY